MPTTQNSGGLQIRQWFNIGALVIASLLGLAAQIIWDGWCGVVVFAATLLLYGIATREEIEADKEGVGPEIGLVYFRGVLQSNDVLKPGRHFGCNFWFIFPQMQTKHEPLRFVVEAKEEKDGVLKDPETTTPDGGPIVFQNFKALVEVDTENIADYVTWRERLKEYLRLTSVNSAIHWAHSRSEGPHDYHEARDHVHEVWNAILRELGCLEKINSTVPTPILMRFFMGKKPTKLDITDGQWTNADTEWEGLKNHLEGLGPNKWEELEKAVRARYHLISQFRTGGLQDGIKIPGRGCKFIAITLACDTTEDWQKQETEAAKAKIAVQKRDTEREQTERELRGYVAAGIPADDVADYQLVQSGKVPKKIDEKKEVFELKGDSPDGKAAAAILDVLRGGGFFLEGGGGGRKRGRS